MKTLKDFQTEGAVGTIVKKTAQGAAATGGAEAADTVMKDYRDVASTGNALATRAVQNVAAAPSVVAKAPKLAKFASGAAEFTGLGKGLLGKAAWPVTVGMAAYDAFKGYNAQPNAPTSTRIRNAGQNALSGVTFGIVPPPPGIKEEKVGKTLKQFREETINEEHDVELEPHPDKPGTHYRVRKISKKSGIKSDQLKAGETLNDTHVDDLKDMGYSVKIHNG